MTVFLGSGVAEPRTLMKCLIDSGLSNTNDLELIQLNSHGDILSLKKLDWQRYRLKTFFSTWVSSEAVVAGSVDLIPGRISQIPRIIKSKRIPIDVAFIQITPPNEAGYCSLGVAVDVSRQAMEQASLVVGEINFDIGERATLTYGGRYVNDDKSYLYGVRAWGTNRQIGGVPGVGPGIDGVAPACRPNTAGPPDPTCGSAASPLGFPARALFRRMMAIERSGAHTISLPMRES